MEETQETNLGDTVRWVVGVAVRRRWWIAVPTCVLAAVAALAAPYTKKVYTSDAVIVVVQQQVSPLYVAPVAADAGAVVRSLTREVLSRRRLSQIIDEFGLYPGAPRSDGLADTMRAGIGLEAIDPNPMVPADFSSFRLSFSAETPQLAQAVTNRLASLFIEENLKTQGERTEATTSFLGSRVQEAKKKLDDQEARLKNFKLNNLGKLPQEQEANLAAITATRAQLQTTLDNLGRAQRERDSIESVLSDDLARLAADKTRLLQQYTTEHPLVVAKDAEIARVQGLLARLRGGPPPAAVPGPSAEGIALAQLRAQIENNATEISSLTGQEQRLRAEVDQYQKRLNLTPVAETQLSALLRDRDQYYQEYSDLLAKQTQSQLTASLEEQRQGQHFRVVDPASFPVAPSKSTALKIIAGGPAAGLGLGLLLAFLLEFSRPSYHTEKEIAMALGLPLVVGVPAMPTVGEKSSARWVRAFEWLAALVLLAAVATAELYTYLGGLSS